jgi:hypothetical protein
MLDFTLNHSFLFNQTSPISWKDYFLECERILELKTMFIDSNDPMKRNSSKYSWEENQLYIYKFEKNRDSRWIHVGFTNDTAMLSIYMHQNPETRSSSVSWSLDGSKIELNKIYSLFMTGNNLITPFYCNC